jgi:hypothetical protein
MAVWSDLDEIIHPHRNAALEHPDLTVRNVRSSGVGHLSLPIHGEVINEICATFVALDDLDTPTTVRPIRPDSPGTPPSDPDSDPTTGTNRAP